MITAYIAGPYSGDTEGNTHRAINAGNALLEAGIAPFVPHLNHYWHQIHPHGYERWMELDFAWVVKCDLLVRLPGASPGADREVKLAEQNGIPVFYSVEEAVRWVNQ